MQDIGSSGSKAVFITPHGVSKYNAGLACEGQGDSRMYMEGDVQFSRAWERRSESFIFLHDTEKLY